MTQYELREALRYMGCKGEPAREIRELAQQGAERLEPVAVFRFRLRRMTLDWEGMLTMDGLPLPGAAIRRRLLGCGEAILLCATLGSGVDQLIRREMLMHPALGLAINGCAAAMLESGLDQVCQDAEKSLCRESLYLTPRFSPGYGDLPLSLQAALLERLEGFRIGLTVTQACQLQPEKSVTALCGVTSKKPAHCGAHCTTCEHPNCVFREEKP